MLRDFADERTREGKFKLTAVAGGLLVLALTLVGAGVSSAYAERLTATGTRIEKPAYNSYKNWGRQLSLPQQGRIVRVMDGTYGFQIVRLDGTIVGDFLFPQDAVGFDLPAGDYELLPLVCQKHLHHHVEVTVEF